MVRAPSIVPAVGRGYRYPGSICVLRARSFAPPLSVTHGIVACIVKIMYPEFVPTQGRLQDHCYEKFVFQGKFLRGLMSVIGETVGHQ